MQNLISLFASIEQEPRLSQPPSGPPPGPDYRREPEYFQALLAYLRQQKREAEQPLGELAEAQEEDILEEVMA